MRDEQIRQKDFFNCGYHTTLCDVTQMHAPAIKKTRKTLYRKYKTLILKRQNLLAE